MDFDLALLESSDCKKARKMSTEELRNASINETTFRQLLLDLKIENNFLDLNKGRIGKRCRQIIQRMFPRKRARAKMFVKELPVDVKDKIHSM